MRPLCSLIGIVKYLTDPWYSIFKEWDELAFHSEDVSEDGNTADLVVRGQSAQ